MRTPPEAAHGLLAIARRRRRQGEASSIEKPLAHSLDDRQRAIRGSRDDAVGETATIAVRGPARAAARGSRHERAPRAATVAALEQAETFTTTGPTSSVCRNTHRAMNVDLVAFLAGEVRVQNERLLEALYVPVQRRVLRRIVELAELYSDRNGEIPLTQEVLAEMAGSTRSTVNEVLREEEKRGTVELRRGRTIVLDPERSRAGRARRWRSSSRHGHDRCSRISRARRACSRSLVATTTSGR